MKTDEREYLNNKLTNIYPFGATLYYLLEKGKVSPLEMCDIFYDKSLEKSSYRFSSVIKRASSKTLREAKAFLEGKIDDSIDENAYSLIQILKTLDSNKDLFINKDYYKYYLKQLNKEVESGYQKTNI